MSKKPNRSTKAIESYQKRKPQPLFVSKEQRAPAPATPAAGAQRTDYLVQLGIEAYQARRLDDAVGYLQSALQMAPDHSLGNNCLGIVLRAQGRLQEAIACYQRALRSDPQYAEAHNNLGVALEAAGDLSRALESYQSALRFKPAFAAALNNLGNALTKSGRPEEALRPLQQVVEQQPTFAAAHNNLGLAYNHLGRLADAERAFRQALALQAAFPEAYLNLGHVLRAAGKLDAAGECYRQALQHHPNYAAARVGLGNVLCDQGESRGAIAEYETALRLQSQLAEAHFGIGNALMLAHDESGAADAWRRALELRPRYAEVHNNIGTLYHRQGHDVLAEKEFLEAVQVKPELLEAHNNLGNLYREQDRMDLAAARYGEVLSRHKRPLASLRLSTLCPAVWSSHEQMLEYADRALAEWKSLAGSHPYQDLNDLLSVANEPPYNLQFMDCNVRSLKEAYARIFRYTGPSFTPVRRTGPIHVGTVVTPNHEVAFLRLIWGALKRMNSEDLQKTIFCSASGATLLRAAIREHEARIVPLPDQPHRVLHAVREQQLDILHYFEICTDALNYFLPFFRLAPVQVTSWGIQVTSGIPTVDAYLSSDLVEAENAQEHYSEKLLRAGTLLAWQTPIAPPTAGKTRADFGFSSSQHLYFCVQHLGKFHPDFDPILAGILRADPRGVIVAAQDKHGYGAQRLRDRFAATMPDVTDRIHFLPRQPFQDYIALAAASDVMLDPLHFGGVTTTYDALSLDKPIVVLPSQFHRGRYTLGCYLRMGVHDCIAKSAEEYVQIAVRLGCDHEWRNQVTERLRTARQRLFEDPESVSEHERLFRELAERSRAA